jgi:hypothetical protein
MKQLYTDTNVYISGLKPDDPFHPDSKAMIKALEQDEIRAETSVGGMPFPYRRKGSFELRR